MEETGYGEWTMVQLGQRRTMTGTTKGITSNSVRDKNGNSMGAQCFGVSGGDQAVPK